MKYIVDNDLHIHSKISSCSSDLEQNNERILQYAIDNSFNTICLTDHFWDDAVDGASDWYKPQNYEHIVSAKPSPQTENVRFLFGCETELNKNMILGISKEKFDLFDFIIIPISHFHMLDYTISREDASSTKGRAAAWLRRFDAVVNMDLPFHKIGLAHLTCGLIAPSKEERLEVIKALPSEEMERLFAKAARFKMGIELNLGDMSFPMENAEIVLRPYRIAKQCGCKFYFGSDAHHPQRFENAKEVFERAVDLLMLTENDKFII